MREARSEDKRLKEYYKYFACPQLQWVACLHLWKTFQTLFLNRCKVLSWAKNTSFFGRTHILFGLHSLEVQSWSWGSYTSARGFWCLCHLATKTAFPLKHPECLIRDQHFLSSMEKDLKKLSGPQRSFLWYFLCSWTPLSIILAVWYSNKEAVTWTSRIL